MPSALYVVGFFGGALGSAFTQDYRVPTLDVCTNAKSYANITTEVLAAGRPLRLRIHDDRMFQQHSLPLSELETRLESEFGPMSTTWEGVALEPPPSVEPVTITVKVHYYGHFQTSGGMWGSRANLSLVTKSADVPGDQLARTMQETMHGKALPEGDSLTSLVGALADEAVAALGDGFRTFDIAGTNEARWVVGLVEPEEVIDRWLELRQESPPPAAIQQAVAMAWGTTISMTAEVRDLQDVSTVTETFESGRILSVRKIRSLQGDLGVCWVLATLVARARPGREGAP